MRQNKEESSFRHSVKERRSNEMNVHSLTERIKKEFNRNEKCSEPKEEKAEAQKQTKTQHRQAGRPLETALEWIFVCM